MASGPDLRELQTLFWQLLTAPEGAAAGASELRRRGELPGDDLSFLVKPGARLGPVERLDVYADMYFYRLRDCLAEDFPKLAARIGPARFHNLVTDYLLAHPSSHFSLRELGRALPGFVSRHRLDAEFAALGDLARLEWARVDVFDAADVTPLSRAALLEAAGAGPEGLGLRRVPASRLLRLDASVLPLWKQLDAGVEARTDAPGGLPRGALVWRRGTAVLHRSLPDDEAGCLEALADGASVAEIGERLLESTPADAEPESAARRLAELLSRWADDELLCAGS